MHIAILGATSQIARDFVRNAAANGNAVFSLYARRSDAAQQWAEKVGLAPGVVIKAQRFDCFGAGLWPNL